MSTHERARLFGAQLNFRTLLAAGIVFSLALWMVLQFGVQTPRARLNVMQAAAALFFAAISRSALAGAAVRENTPDDESRWRLWPALALSAAAWSSVIPCYFTSDDYSLLHQAQSLTNTTTWAFLTRSQATTFFRPLGQASLLLDFQLWHFRPAGYHIVNLLLHLLSVAGVFCLAREFRLRKSTAVTCALIFGVLPIQIEAVAWMICRFDLLAACLAVWAVVFYARYRNSGLQIDYFVAISLFVLAMLSKESGYVVPLLLLPAEIFVFSRPRLKPWSGFAVAGGLMFALRWIRLGGIGGYVSSSGLREVLILHFKTLEGLFVRGPTQALWGINWLEPYGAWFTAVCCALVASLLIVAFSVRPASSDRAAIRFGLCWMFASLLPVHSLILIGPGLTNARVLYMCSVGTAIVVGTLLAGIRDRHLRLAVTGVVALGFSLAVLHNSAAWRWTTELSRTFPDRLKQLEPMPPQNAEFVFVDMPETLRGVFFYRIGLQDVIQMAYGREDLAARREGGEPSPALVSGSRRPVTRLEWDRNPAVLVRAARP